jgi:enoyl-[acyl-carrier-protein] reductase (NADH)
MLHAGLDLSRRKVDVCLLSDEGRHLDQLAVAPDVATAAAYLLSDEADNVTATTLYVDSGYHSMGM